MKTTHSENNNIALIEFDTKEVLIEELTISKKIVITIFCTKTGNQIDLKIIDNK